jgi:ABC-2 type transport system ATP-binding protein
MDMLTITNLKKSYGKTQIIKDLNMTVNPGDVYGFLGKNGAGKTTTFQMISDMLKKDNGTIHLEDGISMGYLPETPSFYEYMTALEYLKFLGQICKCQKDYIIELLELVGLNKHRNKRIKNFSRGMKQRLGIAATLIHDPDIILLDEPTSALDPEGRKEVNDLINKLSQAGKTILLSSHILSDIERVCNRYGILHNGTIVKEWSKEEETTHHFYSIQVKNEASKSLIIKSGLKVIKDDQLQIVVECRDSILNVLYDSGAEVISYSPYNRNLEDVFMEVINQ